MQTALTERQTTRTGTLASTSPTVTTAEYFYNYAGDDPINSTDPSGMWSCNLGTLHGWGTLWHHGVVGCTKTGRRVERKYIDPISSSVDVVGKAAARIPIVRQCLVGGAIGLAGRVALRVAPEYTVPAIGFGCMAYIILKDR